MPDDAVSIDPLLAEKAVLEPVVIAPAVVICPACARSLVHENGTVRLATAADTADLSDSERAALRKSQRQAEMPPRRNKKRG